MIPARTFYVCKTAVTAGLDRKGKSLKNTNSILPFPAHKLRDYIMQSVDNRTGIYGAPQTA